MKNGKLVLKWGVILIVLVYFIGFWLYKLDILPGLHGDEAWFGLKAEQYHQTGVDRLMGMNGYTGILQSLASALSFKYFHIHVFSLRLPGVVCNGLALLAIIILLFRKHQFRTAILFLVCLAQSGTFLIYPKVAWEVTSFNNLFLALLMISMFEFISSNEFKPLPVFLFLFANVVGTYNHIIFSSIALALLGGTGLWIFNNKQYQRLPLLALFLLNAFNIFALEITLRFYSWKIIASADYWPFLLILSALVVESVFATRWTKWVYPVLRYLYRIALPRWLLNAILAVCIMAFTYLHGTGLLHAVSNDAIITNLFSYQFSLLVSFLLVTSGLVITASFFNFLIHDVFSYESSLYGTMITAYLGVFSVYVGAPSVRYYILICAFIGCYLTYEIAKRGYFKRITFPILAALTLSALLTNFTLWEVYSDSFRKVKAISFSIGNDSFETSAHFLPRSPLIDYMKRNQIGEVVDSNRFIKEPVLFYKKIKDWKHLSGRKLTLSYDYEHDGSGYIMGFKDARIDSTTRKDFSHRDK